MQPYAEDEQAGVSFTSVSSSMTSALSAITSPNTSFSTVSRDESDMDFDWEAISITDDTSIPATHILPAQHVNTVTDFASKLRSGSPFTSHNLIQRAKVPFRQIYEVERAARATNVEISHFSECLSEREDDYPTLWSSICNIIKAHKVKSPEPSTSNAWKNAQEEFCGVSLTARLQFNDQESFFELQFFPLKLESTYRLSRHFGGDRFCVLSIPSLNHRDLPTHLKPHAEAFRSCFINWLVNTQHEMLGRTWRAFFVKPAEAKKKRPGNLEPNDTGFRVYLFAEDGQGFWHIERPVGEKDPRLSYILDRQRLTIQQMIEWFMPFNRNKDQHVLKFFARLSLGLTSTVKTTQFKPNQIIRSDDAFADSPSQRRLDMRLSDLKKTGRSLQQNQSAVMNDGCARISRTAASYIAIHHLNLDYIPSAFQGRIGGAKGIWFVDTLAEVSYREGEDDDLWIEITDSQLKYEAASIDSLSPDVDRVTFEANSWSRPLSSNHLNFQLLPILYDRGVPRQVFQELLKKDLEIKTSDLEGAMENGLGLRKWCQANHPVIADRLKKGCIEMLGGLPDERFEKVNWFIDHGFEAQTCAALKKLVLELIRDHCTRLENRMNIGLESSTNAFMIADPLNLLEADEVHIAFSGRFKDPQGFEASMLHGVDVLVARLPAHLPSDIQKVRAVFRPELRIYRDVIIFSSRGDRSLASKLSGGDYDGDKAWICWEPSLVEPFHNVPVPEEKSSEFYGIEKDTSRISDIMQRPDYINQFLKHSFDFNLQPRMLGIITNYHESLCYAEGGIGSPAAISIAQLLGLLVDAPKAGIKFPHSKWIEYCTKHKLPAWLPKPAYRNKDSPRFKADSLIDDLVFNTAKPVCQSVLTAISQKFSDADIFDVDLVRLSRTITREADSDISVANALNSVKAACKQLVEYWQIQSSHEDNKKDNVFRQAATMKSTTLDYRALVRKIRAGFIAIAPCPNDAASLAAASPLVRRWANEYYCTSSATGGPSDNWSLFKASVAYSQHSRSSCIWYMAGIELGELKATAKGRGSYRTIVREVFDALKVDGRLADAFVRRSREEEDGGDSNKGLDMLVAGGFEGGEEEGGEEFGEWGWEDGI